MNYILTITFIHDSTCREERSKQGDVICVMLLQDGDPKKGSGTGITGSKGRFTRSYLRKICFTFFM